MVERRRPGVWPGVTHRRAGSLRRGQVAMQTPGAFTGYLRASLRAVADVLDGLGQSEDAMSLRRLAGAGPLDETAGWLSGQPDHERAWPTSPAMRRRARPDARVPA